MIAGGYCLPRCLHVVAELGVADALDETPRTAHELAQAVGVNANALTRVLRLLCAHGVFAVDGHTIVHTPVSRLLRSDHPQSMRAFARMLGLDINWRIFKSLGQSVHTGNTATQAVVPDGYWHYFAEHPEAAGIFNAAMVGKTHAQIAGIMASHDFSGFACIGDIGGGSGHLLCAVLDAAPEANGVLFDLPHVIKEDAPLASDRITLQAGDFFKDDLPVCDLYLLMEVVHDWPDEEATDILSAIRRAAPAGAKLLVIEEMLSGEPGPEWAKVLDILMLGLLGGRQRTRVEHQALLEAAGFAFTREIPTGSGASIIEAVAA
ncbi:MAG TPA: methyltransferase [Rhodanobacteraceae bacterium]|nr:methyltransferase [Rhodanobacteraceae bacterium]